METISKRRRLIDFMAIVGDSWGPMSQQAFDDFINTFNINEQTKILEGIKAITYVNIKKLKKVNTNLNNFNFENIISRFALLCINYDWGMISIDGINLSISISIFFKYYYFYFKTFDDLGITYGYNINNYVYNIYDNFANNGWEIFELPFMDLNKLLSNSSSIIISYITRKISPTLENNEEVKKQNEESKIKVIMSMATDIVATNIVLPQDMNKSFESKFLNEYENMYKEKYKFKAFDNTLLAHIENMINIVTSEMLDYVNHIKRIAKSENLDQFNIDMFTSYLTGYRRYLRDVKSKIESGDGNVEEDVVYKENVIIENYQFIDLLSKEKIDWERDLINSNNFLTKNTINSSIKTYINLLLSKSPLYLTILSVLSDINENYFDYITDKVAFTNLYDQMRNIQSISHFKIVFEGFKKYVKLINVGVNLCTYVRNQFDEIAIPSAFNRYVYDENDPFKTTFTAFNDPYKTPERFNDISEDDFINIIQRNEKKFNYIFNDAVIEYIGTKKFIKNVYDTLQFDIDVEQTIGYEFNPEPVKIEKETQNMKKIEFRTSNIDEWNFNIDDFPSLTFELKYMLPEKKQDEKPPSDEMEGEKGILQYLEVILEKNNITNTIKHSIETVCLAINNLVNFGEIKFVMLATAIEILKSLEDNLNNILNNVHIKIPAHIASNIYSKYKFEKTTIYEIEEMRVLANADILRVLQYNINNFIRHRGYKINNTKQLISLIDPSKCTIVTSSILIQSGRSVIVWDDRSFDSKNNGDFDMRNIDNEDIEEDEIFNIQINRLNVNSTIHILFSKSYLDDNVQIRNVYKQSKNINKVYNITNSALQKTNDKYVILKVQTNEKALWNDILNSETKNVLAKYGDNMGIITKKINFDSMKKTNKKTEKKSEIKEEEKKDDINVKPFDIDETPPKKDEIPQKKDDIIINDETKKTEQLIEKIEQIDTTINKKPDMDIDMKSMFSEEYDDAKSIPSLKTKKKDNLTPAKKNLINPYDDLVENLKPIYNGVLSALDYNLNNQIYDDFKLLLLDNIKFYNKDIYDIVEEYLINIGTTFIHEKQYLLFKTYKINFINYTLEDFNIDLLSKSNIESFCQNTFNHNIEEALLSIFVINVIIESNSYLRNILNYLDYKRLYMKNATFLGFIQNDLSPEQINVLDFINDWYKYLKTYTDNMNMILVSIEINNSTFKTNILTLINDVISNNYTRFRMGIMDEIKDWSVKRYNKIKMEEYQKLKPFIDFINSKPFKLLNKTLKNVFDYKVDKIITELDMYKAGVNVTDMMSLRAYVEDVIYQYLTSVKNQIYDIVKDEPAFNDYIKNNLLQNKLGVNEMLNNLLDQMQMIYLKKKGFQENTIFYSEVLALISKIANEYGDNSKKYKNVFGKIDDVKKYFNTEIEKNINNIVKKATDFVKKAEAEIAALVLKKTQSMNYIAFTKQFMIIINNFIKKSVKRNAFSKILTISLRPKNQIEPIKHYTTPIKPNIPKKDTKPKTESKTTNFKKLKEGNISSGVVNNINITQTSKNEPTNKSLFNEVIDMTANVANTIYDIGIKSLSTGIVKLDNCLNKVNNNLIFLSYISNNFNVDNSDEMIDGINLAIGTNMKISYKNKTNIPDKTMINFESNLNEINDAFNKINDEDIKFEIIKIILATGVNNKYTDLDLGNKYYIIFINFLQSLSEFIIVLEKIFTKSIAYNIIKGFSEYGYIEYMNLSKEYLKNIIFSSSDIFKEFDLILSNILTSCYISQIIDTSSEEQKLNDLNFKLSKYFYRYIYDMNNEYFKQIYSIIQKIKLIPFQFEINNDFLNVFLNMKVSIDKFIYFLNTIMDIFDDISERVGNNESVYLDYSINVRHLIINIENLKKEYNKYEKKCDDGYKIIDELSTQIYEINLLNQRILELEENKIFISNAIDEYNKIYTDKKINIQLNTELDNLINDIEMNNKNLLKYRKLNDLNGEIDKIQEIINITNADMKVINDTINNLENDIITTIENKLLNDIDYIKTDKVYHTNYTTYNKRHLLQKYFIKKQKNLQIKQKKTLFAWKNKNKVYINKITIGDLIYKINDRIEEFIIYIDIENDTEFKKIKKTLPDIIRCSEMIDYIIKKLTYYINHFIINNEYKIKIKQIYYFFVNITNSNEWVNKLKYIDENTDINKADVIIQRNLLLNYFSLYNIESNVIFLYSRLPDDYLDILKKFISFDTIKSINKDEMLVFNNISNFISPFLNKIIPFIDLPILDLLRNINNTINNILDLDFIILELIKWIYNEKNIDNININNEQLMYVKNILLNILTYKSNVHILAINDDKSIIVPLELYKKMIFLLDHKNFDTYTSLMCSHNNAFNIRTLTKLAQYQIKINANNTQLELIDKISEYNYWRLVYKEQDTKLNVRLIGRSFINNAYTGNGNFEDIIKFSDNKHFRMVFSFINEKNSNITDSKTYRKINQFLYKLINIDYENLFKNKWGNLPNKDILIDHYFNITIIGKEYKQFFSTLQPKPILSSFFGYNTPFPTNKTKQLIFYVYDSILNIFFEKISKFTDKSKLLYFLDYLDNIYISHNEIYSFDEKYLNNIDTIIKSYNKTNPTQYYKDELIQTINDILNNKFKSMIDYISLWGEEIKKMKQIDNDVLFFIYLTEQIITLMVRIDINKNINLLSNISNNI